VILLALLGFAALPGLARTCGTDPAAVEARIAELLSA